MRWHLRLGLVFVACAAGQVFGQSHAVAITGAEGYGSISTGGIAAQASWTTTGSGNSAGSSSASGASDPCQYFPATAATDAALGPGGPTPGQWYFTSCAYFGGAPGAGTFAPVWAPTGAAPGAAPSVPGLIDQAKGQAGLVDPEVILDPPGRQVVNFASWLAVPQSEWHVVVASATAGGVTATVTATPTQVDWNMGDGDSLTCDGPGVIYDSSKPASSQSTYCSYTWPRPSYDQPGGTFTVSATIIYQVTTTVTGAPDPTPALGTTAGPPAQMAVTVTEVEALGSSSQP